MTTCNEPGCVDGEILADPTTGLMRPCPSCSPAKSAVEAVCEALRPCPFCEGPAKLVGVGAWNKCSAAYCDNCEIYGPMMATKETAAYAWNRRSAPAPQSVEAVGEAVRYTSEHVPPFRMLVVASEYDRARARCFDFEAMAERGSRACARMQSERDAALASLQEMRVEVAMLTEQRNRYHALLVEKGILK